MTWWLVAQASWEWAEAIQKFGSRCESDQFFSVAYNCFKNMCWPNKDTRGG